MWFRVDFSWVRSLNRNFICAFLFLSIFNFSSNSFELSDELVDEINNKELTKQVCLDSPGEVVREEGSLVAHIMCIGLTPMELDGAIINASVNKIHETVRFKPENIKFFLRNLISGKLKIEYRTIEILEVCKMDRSNANGCAHAFNLQGIRNIGYKIGGVIWPDKATPYAYNVYLGISVDF